MALYLGREKMAPILKGGAVSSGISCATGTVTSDEYGVITFPELDFTPTMITVWNVEKRDLKAEAEEGGEEWDDSCVRYVYDGLMLMAINQEGVWISQGLCGGSGEVNITNASATGGTQEFLPEESSSGISSNGNVYSYMLGRYNGYGMGANIELNYAIYG